MQLSGQEHQFVHEERYWTHQLRQLKQRAELKMARQITKREEEE